MKLLGYVSCALIASLIVGQSAFAAPADGNETKQPVKSEPKDALAEASSSREAMLESMADPIANKAFHDLQLQVLQTPSDAMVYQYFAKSPIFAKLYQFLVRHNDSLLLGFEMQAKSQMVQAVRGLTPQYDLVDKLVVEVATSLGFTKEAIANRQIYLLGGEENAFTVSGSQNKIIVAFQRGILRTMTRSEIAGVLAHELGHIRAEHTVKGIMNSIMMELVGELFVNGRITVSPQDANVNNRLKNIECFGCKIHDHKNETVEKVMASLEATLTGKSIAASQHQNFDLKLGATSNPKLKMIDQQIQEFVIQFASMDKAHLQQAIGSYLQLMIRVAQAEKAPVQTIQYFATLLHNVSQIGSFRVNMQEYLMHAKMAEFAISRAKETTADQVSAATVRNEHLASAFSKLLGLDFEKEFRPQIFDQIKKQAVDLLKNTPPELLPSFVGTTHPSLVLRINNVLNIPAYPSVLLANNYLRLLFLNEGLINAEARARAYLISFEAQVKADTQAVEDRIAEVLAQAKPEEIAEAKVQAEQVRATAKKEIEEARKQILPQVEAITKSQRDLETKIFQLLFESEFRIDGKRAPRMENTIQYFAVQREVMYLNFDAVKKRMEEIMAMKIVDPRQIQMAELELRNLKASQTSIVKNLELQKAFIERVVAKFEAVNKSTVGLPDANVRKKYERYLLLKSILEAKSSDELQRVRARVTGAPAWREQVYRSNKVPVKIAETNVYAPGAGPVCSGLFNR